MKNILSIQIKKINLKVKFPCSICCAVKFDGKQIDVPGEEELKNGEAKLNFAYNHELILQNGKLISQLKGSILIFLKTSSGRMPAGSVIMKLSKLKNISLKQVSIINKCPDKNAFLEYQLKLEQLHHVGNIKKRSIETQELHSNRFSQITQKVDKRNVQKSFRQSSQSLFNQRSRSPFTFNQEHSTISIIKKHSKQKDIDFKVFERYGFRGNEQISQQKIYAIQKELQNTKSKLNIIEDQITRKDSLLRQSEQSSKYLLKHNQQLQVQLKTSNYKLELLDKQYKQLTVKLRESQQRHELQKASFESGIKRIQIRENSYKEQIKLLTDKFYNSQNQKQRMIYQKNLSTNEYESRQKKLRQSYKQKERKYLQQKAILQKKIDIYQKDIQQSSQQIDHYKNKYSQLLQQNNEYQILNENYKADNQQLKIEYNNLRYELTKMKNEKLIMESNLQSNSKFNEERRLLKRQLSNKEIQNIHLKDRINEQYDRLIKQKEKQIEMALLNIQNGRIEIEGLNKQRIQRQKKLILLNEQLQFEIQKNKTYQKRINQVQQQMYDLIDQFNKQQNTLYEKVKSLEQQLQLNNQIIVQKSTNVQYFEKQCHQYQRNIKQRNKIIQEYESQIEKLNQIIQGLQFQKQYQQQMIRQHQETLKEKEQEYINTINDLKQKLQLYVSEHQQSVKTHSQKINSMLIRQKEAAETVKSKKELIEKLQQERTVLLESNQKLKRQIACRGHENQQKKQDILDLQMKLNQKNIQVECLNYKCKEMQQLKIQITKMKGQIKQQIQKINHLEMTNATLSDDLKQERQHNKLTMRQLQHQRHLFQKLKIQHQQKENKFLFKDIQIRKQQMKCTQLKNIIQLIFTLIQTQNPNDQTIQQLKFMIKKSTLNEIQPIKEELIKYQHRIQHLLRLQHQSYQSKDPLQNSIDTLQKDILLLKQEIQQKRSEMSNLQNYVGVHQKMKVAICSQLIGVQKYVDQLLKSINSIQADKKMSIFMIALLKSNVKKISGSIMSVIQKLQMNSEAFIKTKKDYKFRTSLVGSNFLKFG